MTDLDRAAADRFPLCRPLRFARRSCASSPDTTGATTSPARPHTVGREFVIGWVYDEQRCERCGKIRRTP